MYAIIIKFDILKAEALPSIGVVVESLQRTTYGVDRVEHVRAQRRSAHLSAVAFITATDAERALHLGELAARAIEQSTPSLRLASIRRVKRPPAQT